MASSTGKQLKVTVVTPERAVLDEAADAVTLPMFDGELGVLPGRAALIGRLGHGVLRLTAGGQTKRVFVDGGFAQVRADVVTVLTAKALSGADLTADKVEAARRAAAGLPATDAVGRANREKALDRARAMTRAAAQFVPV